MKPFSYSSIKQLFLLFLLVNLFGACAKKRKIEPSFYHWKTTFDISSKENQLLTDMEVKRLYTRFFDVDWNSSKQEGLPIAELNIVTDSFKNVEIVPTVFITNRTMKHTPHDKVEQLADNIYAKIQRITEKMHCRPITELQFDCDWTPSTQKKYFHLLEQIRMHADSSKIALSSTIRLHQVKYYKKTGVPPVDRGVLMFYNMGELDKVEEENSILNLETAQKYMVNFDKYPIPLDAALPLFSWGVLIRRNKPIKLINYLQTSDLTDTTKYQILSDKRFKVLKSHYQKGYYLYKNDQIRIEDIPIGKLVDAAEMLDEHMTKNDIKIIFYHLNVNVLKQYSLDDLNYVCHKLE